MFWEFDNSQYTYPNTCFAEEASRQWPKWPCMTSLTLMKPGTPAEPSSCWHPHHAALLKTSLTLETLFQVCQLWVALQCAKTAMLWVWLHGLKKGKRRKKEDFFWYNGRPLPLLRRQPTSLYVYRSGIAHTSHTHCVCGQKYELHHPAPLLSTVTTGTAQLELHSLRRKIADGSEFQKYQFEMRQTR